MNRVSLIAGIAGFVALALFYGVFGFFYASVQDILFFHAAAVPEPARDSVRPLYFALMKLIGAAVIGLALLGAFVTFTAVRRGDRPAAVALFVAYAIPLFGAAYVAETLASATGAPTSWHIMGALLLIDAIALAGVVAGGGRKIA